MKLCSPPLPLWLFLCVTLSLTRGFAANVPMAGPERALEANFKALPGRVIWDLSRVGDRATSRVQRLELTSLVRHRGYFYCGFREGEIHGSHPTGRGRIIRSADGEHWESAALFEWDGADVREPKLAITAEGRLMVYTSIYFVSREPRADGAYYQVRRGTPDSEVEAEVARQSVTWLSSDGLSWSPAYACPTGVNTWRWDIHWHNGMGYSFGYAGKDDDGVLYRTRDGKAFRVLKEQVFPEGAGNEAGLAFGTDDTLYCLLRGAPGSKMLGMARPPYYLDWEWKDVRADWDGSGNLLPAREAFGTVPGGPLILRLKDGRLLGAGRVVGGISLFWIDPEKAVFTRFARIAGSSYPGVVEHEGELWVTSSDSEFWGTSADGRVGWVKNLQVPSTRIFLTRIKLPPKAD